LRQSKGSAVQSLLDSEPLDRAKVTERVASAGGLRVLFLASAHNSLSQRLLTELTALGHEVKVAVVRSGPEMEAAVHQHRPQLIVCPMLKTRIPELVWSRYRCLVVHPGPRGDRGPSSLDWAIELGAGEWGVTVLEADRELDGGQVWSTRRFPMPQGGKSSLYRHEVRRAATAAVVEAITAIADDSSPDRLDSDEPAVIARPRPFMTQDVRAIDWRSDPTDSVIRKLRAAEGHPGVRDMVAGVDCFLFGGHPESSLHGRPGDIISQRAGAICRATVDGAVWISHLKRCDTSSRQFFKLPAAHTLALAGTDVVVPETTVAIDAPLGLDDTFREIVYHEHGAVGYLRFEFYNGAMSTDQCRRLLDAYRYARAQAHTKVIVLTGGSDFFSNGIHLNVIEAAPDPAAESWRNLNAIDDLVREIIDTDSHLVISALVGDAAAGGVTLALAADYALARRDAVLNPYYQHMGGLYGSEYWTYLLPRRIGPEPTARLTGAPFTPLSAKRATHIGLIDDAVGDTADAFRLHVDRFAAALAADPGLNRRLDAKRRRRDRDEHVKPLDTYRSEELTRCQECFFGADPSYHEARRRFVYKLGPTCGVAPHAVSPTAATLTQSIKHYEQRVLAWYALGRVAEARSARDAIASQQPTDAPPQTQVS
jgi:putative two-component system hydrogenase maturation factor HypX/HoxX